MSRQWETSHQIQPKLQLLLLLLLLLLMLLL
jgi:hypothetical protein